ncbi:hypothetical protein BIV23_39260 [Streptomyces monashensis]|uniref:Alpha-L-arabinofuranosidase B catalytic domain-containing protein n=1 Tax=Streptomyces monashensis TaxID=1678012 RepID=A0A1S2PE31_9ACTN|nr:hypothetical protein BIV23_39260 [Streptomyces monashensis]
MTAHSTTRALFASYNGPLYQIQRASDHSYRDIGVLGAGVYAGAASRVSFRAGTPCTVTKPYDQTAGHNDLPISWGGYWNGPGPGGSDVGADAMPLPVTAAGHQVFGIKVTPPRGYRLDHASGVATSTGARPVGSAGAPAAARGSRRTWRTATRSGRATDPVTAESPTPSMTLRGSA